MSAVNHGDGDLDPVCDKARALVCVRRTGLIREIIAFYFTPGNCDLLPLGKADLDTKRNDRGVTFVGNETKRIYE